MLVYSQRNSHTNIVHGILFGVKLDASSASSLVGLDVLKHLVHLVGIQLYSQSSFYTCNADKLVPAAHLTIPLPDKFIMVGYT